MAGTIQVVSVKHFSRIIKLPSLQFSHSVVFDSLQSHGLHHTRLPCPSPIPRACSNSCPSSLWCHPTISSSVVPFSSCLQSFPASGSFPMSQFFISGGQRIGVSASVSVLAMNIQDWFPSGLTPVFLPGKSHGWRSLVGYCPWGRKESDTTERFTITIK